MTEDHLDKGVSISGQLVERGIQFKAHSRAVSGVDRLLGNLTELINAPLERRTARIRAEKDMIDALGRAAIEHIDRGTDLAKQILESSIQRVAQRHFNKQEVVAAALEDLTSRPPDPEQSASGPANLDPAFLNRLERYAEDAEDDAAHEKWARVLAGEIRQPGRFTAKTMRLIDEISPEVAQTFHALCRERINDCTPKLLCGELSFKTRASLENAGLLTQSNGDTTRIFSKSKGTDSQDEIWLGSFGERAIGVAANSNIPSFNIMDDTDKKHNLVKFKDRLNLPIYLLTVDGQAIASLSDHNEGAAWQSLITALSETLPEITILDLKRGDGGFHIVGQHRYSPSTEGSS